MGVDDVNSNMSSFSVCKKTKQKKSIRWRDDLKIIGSNFIKSEYLYNLDDKIFGVQPELTECTEILLRILSGA